MSIRNHLLLLLLTASLTLAATASADSKRVHVYSISQQYWDVQPGDTLSGIAMGLFPNNRSMQHHLMQDIIELNPDAFSHGNPDLIIAGSRLYLPGEMRQRDTRVESDDVEVRSFSWGNIKSLKR